MKLLSSLLVLFVSSFSQRALSQAPSPQPVSAVVGTWQGYATARGGQQVPVTLRISGSGSALQAAFLNGPTAHPDESPASSVHFDGTHLTVTFDYFARSLNANLNAGTLTGTYGAIRSAEGGRSAPVALTLNRVARKADPAAAANAPDISGAWEIVTHSPKGEAAWEFRVDPPQEKTPVIKAVIQRIDGDTGGLWGVWNGTSYTLGHFTAAGPALYSVTPQADGTLVVRNLVAAPRPGAPAELVARRPAEARKLDLPKPTDPTQQTTVKDPNVPFAFSFPDLSGKVVSNTDPRFQGKVVIVAIGGSWCPNCHDEAPFLVSLYRKYHARGLEIVGLDFEQGDPDTDTARLKAFIAHYGIEYPMLAAGTTDELADKIPQGVNLNCWPTSFFLGRDGRVKLVHAGFAGPGNTAGHEELVREETELVERLLAEPAPATSAQR